MKSDFESLLKANVQSVQGAGARMGRFGFAQAILSAIRGSGERDGSLIKAAAKGVYDLFIAPKTPGTEIDDLAHTFIDWIVDQILSKLVNNPTPAAT